MVRWPSVHWGFLSCQSLWLQKCRVRWRVTEGKEEKPQSPGWGGGWSLAQQCLPWGQPPSGGSVHELQGGAWSIAFYSGVCPQTVSGDPCSCPGDHGHSEVHGFTGTGGSPRGALQAAAFPAETNTAWPLGSRPAPDPWCSNELGPGASGPLSFLSGCSWGSSLVLGSL